MTDESAKTDVTKSHVEVEFKHDVPLTCCKVDPSGRFAFAGAEDLNVYRWEIGGDPKAKSVLEGHDSWVRSLDFSHDGEFLYTGAYDDHIGIWNTAAEKPKPVKMVRAHDGWVRWVRVSPDGKLLAW